MKTDEKLRKLKPCFNKTDLMWLFWLASEGEERDEVDELLDIMMNSELSKDYSKAIFLEPPNPKTCFGDYHFGNVIYPGKPYCTFGLRENEWIKHVLITGMSEVDPIGWTVMGSD